MKTLNYVLMLMLTANVGLAQTNYLFIDGLNMGKPIDSTSCVTNPVCPNASFVTNVFRLDVDENSFTYTNMCFSTNTLNIAAKSGAICKQFGHNWRSGRKEENDGLIFATYHPEINYRTCRICGITQTQSLNWK